MSASRPPLPEVVYRDGLHLAGTVLWFDASRARDLAFVSHAHAASVLPHRKMLMTDVTLRLLRAERPAALARLRPSDVLVCPFGRKFSLGALDLELLPAGHVLGSAQLVVRVATGQTVLYAGDVCLDRRAVAEACEMRRADVLVLDNTFGAPEYRFPPRTRLLADVVEWCRERLGAGDVPVLLAAPLGAAQELAHALAAAKIPVRAHAAIQRYARAFAQAGLELGAARLGARTPVGEVVLLPPAARALLEDSRWAKARVALCSGWAALPDVVNRAHVHAAFALADHAGFEDLVRYVEAVAPRVVYLTRTPHPAFEAAIARGGRTVRTVAPPTQLDLFQRP